MGQSRAGQITLVYQPKLDIASCQVLGVEALVRWQHPERGLVMPGEFLPIIENTEMMGPLTWHVLDLALASARSGARVVCSSMSRSTFRAQPR